MIEPVSVIAIKKQFHLIVHLLLHLQAGIRSTMSQVKCDSCALDLLLGKFEYLSF